MKKIFKYKLARRNSIRIPVSAIPLSVGIQNEDICLWAIVDEEEEKADRFFLVLCTGEPFQFKKGHRGVFVGTVQDGAYVYHVFEIFKDD